MINRLFNSQPASVALRENSVFRCDIKAIMRKFRINLLQAH